MGGQNGVVWLNNSSGNLKRVFVLRNVWEPKAININLCGDIKI